MTEVNYSAAAKAVIQARAVIAQLRSKRSELQAECQTLRARNLQLMDMPLARGDAKQTIFDVIDARGAEFLTRARWGQIFNSFAFPTSEEYKRELRRLYGEMVPAISMRTVEKAFENGSESIASMFGPGALNMFAGADGVSAGSTSHYFFFGELLKQKVEQHFDTLFPDIDPLNECTTSLAERRAEIASNKEREFAIVSQLGEIDRQCNALDTSTV